MRLRAVRTLTAAWVMLFAHAAFAAETTAVGACVPFNTYEAEQAESNGSVIRLQGFPKANLATSEIEASGRSFVRLEGHGQYCEFKASRPGNALTIRYSVPDASAGGGATATLSLYRNGDFVEKLALSSRFSWLYGDVTGRDGGQSNDPRAGTPRVFWNDSRFLLADKVWRKGDVLRLQLDADDSAEYVGIDLVDLERVPAPRRPPRRDSYLSVVEFGATGDDSTDDSAAIDKCLAAAKEKSSIVWFPPGVYHHSRSFRVDGLTIQGAGMWHTELVGTAADLGFSLSGDGARVTDLLIESTAHHSRKDPGGKAFRSRTTDKWSVENVCIMHTNVGFWLSGAKHGTIRSCRVYCTYADAINVNRSSSHNLIEHNYVRGAGDDGIATLAERKDPEPSNSNTIRRNTVIASWWGHNIDVAGGHGHVVEGNYLADNSHSACIAFNLPPAYPMHPLTGAIIRDNTIVRGGGNFARQRRGAIWTLAGGAPITGVRIEGNRIVDPLFRGLHLHGSARQEILFRNNEIESPGLNAIHIEKKVTGKLVLSDNEFRGLPASSGVVTNTAGPQFELVESNGHLK
jgi:hypothetical protein